VFVVTVTAVSPDKLTGNAKTEITRDDFGLQIPSVPFVANVSPTVKLEFDFVAVPVKG
jgi:hypothetical protein